MPRPARRPLAFLVLGLALSTSVRARAGDGVPPRPAPPAAPPLLAWPAEERDVRIPMRDGASLAANVLRPREPGRYPAIVVQTPYDKNRMGREYGDARRVGEVARGSEAAWARFDRAHYVYVFVDWRGFFASKGAMEGVDRRTWRRGLDGYDVVEWTAAQPWCDGKVGTWGGSALGKQQLDTAAERPPHLACAVPLIAAMGQRYEAFYEGGVRLEGHVKSLDALGFGVGALVSASPLPFAPVWAFARRRTYHPEQIDVPCLFVSGWWDNYPREVIETFEDVVAKGGDRARAESRLVMGPWSHTAIDVAEQGDLAFSEAAGYSTTLTLRFFDRFLRGMTEGWDAVPRVHAFQAGDARWLTAARFGDIIGTPHALTLRPDGTISREPDAAEPVGPAVRTYRYDPRDASPTVGGRNLPPLSHGPKNVSGIASRPDVLAWSTPTLETALTMRGEAEVSLTVSCDRPDVDVSVRLCDTFPGGAGSYLVGETIERASLRDGRASRPMKPGEPVSLVLRLPPHAWTFLPGHRATLLVTSGNWPRYERNPHTGAPAWDEAAAVPATVTVRVGVGEATLSLPLVGR
jgi:predicted acyl esterase